MLELYKSEDRFGLVTDADNERDFTSAFCAAVAGMIREKKMDEDSWEALLVPWITQHVEVVAKLRGYKSTVRVRTLIEAGEFTPGQTALEVKVDTKGKVIVPESEGITA